MWNGMFIFDFSIDDMTNILLENVFFVLIFYSLLLVNFKELFYDRNG